MSDLWQKARALWSEFSGIGPGTYASSIAYFAFLSLVPILALCISLVSFAGIDQDAIAAFITALMPEALEDLVQSLIADAFTRSRLAFSLSTIMLLWAAAKSMKALRAGLNAAYSKQEDRSFPALVAISILGAVILGVLLAAAMYVMFSGGVMRTLANLIPGYQPQDVLFTVLNLIATLFWGTLALTICYAFLPAGTHRLLAQVPGAICASLACSVLSVGFRIYVDHFSNYTALYGSIGTVALLLLWIYLVAYIVIAGAFLNRSLADPPLSPTHPEGEPRETEG